MKNIILTMLATLVVAGCGGSDGDNTIVSDAGSGADSVPISVDVSKPPTEVPPSDDDLQACMAIESVKLTDLAGNIVEWTTRSMTNPEEMSSQQCIPPDSSIPVDSDGYPQFIVIDLYDITGVDLVHLISEQLVPVGEYVSMSLSILQGEYGDFLGTPYSYVGSLVDKQKMEVVDELTFDGLDINIDVPETFTMAFDFRSMIQMVEGAYYLKSEGLRLVKNALSGGIFGDINTGSCPSNDDAYVYLYESDSEQYGDLGSEYTPVMTAKVTEENQYTMSYVPEGDYDVVLVCDGLKDAPDQIDLDIDLDGDAAKYTDQHVESGEQKYLPL